MFLERLAADPRRQKNSPAEAELLVCVGWCVVLFDEELEAVREGLAKAEAAFEFLLEMAVRKDIKIIRLIDLKVILYSNYLMLLEKFHKFITSSEENFTIE